MLLSHIFSRLRAWSKYWNGVRELRDLNNRELSELGLERGRARGVSRGQGVAWRNLREIVLESR